MHHLFVILIIASYVCVIKSKCMKDKITYSKKPGMIYIDEVNGFGFEILPKWKQKEILTRIAEKENITYHAALSMLCNDYVNL